MHGIIAATVSGPAILGNFDFTGFTPGQIVLPAGAGTWARASSGSVHTSSTTVVIGVTNDVPYAYADGPVPVGLRIHETRTNMVQDSNNPLAASWQAAGGAGTTQTPNYVGVVSPDNTNDAARMVQIGNGFQKWYRIPGLAGVYTCSAWGRGTSAPQSTQVDYGISTVLAKNWTTTWERIHITATGLPSVFLIELSNTAVTADFLQWLFQIEAGAWPGPEITTSGGIGTFAGEQWHFPAAQGGPLFDPSGRLTMYTQIYPFGSSTEYTSNMRIATDNANNYAEVDHTTGKVNCVANGVSYTTPVAASWSEQDFTEWFVAWGGGSYPTSVKVRVNGGAITTLSTGSPPMQAAMPVGALDLMCAGTSNQFSSVIRSLTTYRAGFGPVGWV